MSAHSNYKAWLSSKHMIMVRERYWKTKQWLWRDVLTFLILHWNHHLFLILTKVFYISKPSHTQNAGCKLSGVTVHHFVCPPSTPTPSSSTFVQYTNIILHVDFIKKRHCQVDGMDNYRELNFFLFFGIYCFHSWHRYTCSSVTGMHSILCSLHCITDNVIQKGINLPKSRNNILQHLTIQTTPKQWCLIVLTYLRVIHWAIESSDRSGHILLQGQAHIVTFYGQISKKKNQECDQWKNMHEMPIKEEYAAIYSQMLVHKSLSLTE